MALPSDMKPHKGLGSYYGKTSSWQADRWEDLMMLFEENIYDDFQPIKALDIGCGSGERTCQLFEKFPSLEYVTGVDPHFSMIAAANEKSSSWQLDFQQMGAAEIGQLESKDYSLVQSNYALHWVEDKTAFMQGLNSITLPDTYLAVGTCQDLPHIFYDIDKEVKRALHISHHQEMPFYYLNIAQWSALLEKFGWRMMSVVVRNDLHLTENPAAFVKHWFAASTEKTLYGRQLDDIKPPIFNAIVSMVEEKYGYHDEDHLLFNEETVLFIAKKEA